MGVSYTSLAQTQVSGTKTNWQLSSSYIVKSGTTLTVNGYLNLYTGKLVVEEGATLIVNGYVLSANAGTLTMNGEMTVNGNFNTRSCNYINLNGYTKVTGSLRIGSDKDGNIGTGTYGLTIGAAGYVNVEGEVIVGGSKCTLYNSGKLVVGQASYSPNTLSGKVTLSSGTITNKGTINIQNSGSITSMDLVNNGTINLKPGYLILQGNATLKSGSTLNYNSGYSAVEVKSNLIQENGAKITMTSGTGDLIVEGTLTDKTYYGSWSTNGSYRDHPWGLSGGGSSWNFVVRSNFALYAHSFVFDGTCNALLSTTEKAMEKKLKSYTNGYNYVEKTVDSRKETISQLLPIVLSYFEAYQEDDGIAFEWATESEYENEYFTIEGSLDGVMFEDVLQTQGAGTTSSRTVYYETIASSKYNGVVYFRLRQTDYNGAYTYSDVIAVNIENNVDDFVVYPIPASDYIYVDGGNFKSVYFVDTRNVKYPARAIGNNQYSVANLSNGIYFMVITTNKGVVVKEFMKVTAKNAGWEE